jgi:hypothetical protein
MAYDHHVSEDLTDLFDCVFSGLMLEQRDEDVFKPVGVESLLFLIYFEDSDDARIFELSESSFHEFDEFLFHLFAEDLIGFFVVC